MKKAIRYFLVFFVSLTTLILCSCTKTIITTSDELRSNSYMCTLENGSKISLTFTEDTAQIDMSAADGTKAQICGFCEFSDTQFVVFDKQTKATFPFIYKLNYDSVDIIYEGDTLSFDKI